MDPSTGNLVVAGGFTQSISFGDVTHASATPPAAAIGRLGLAP